MSFKMTSFCSEHWKSLSKPRDFKLKLKSINSDNTSQKVDYANKLSLNKDLRILTSTPSKVFT